MTNGVDRASEMSQVLKQIIDGKRYQVGLQMKSSLDNRKAHAQTMSISGMLREQQGGQCG